MKNLALIFGLILFTSFGFAQETEAVGEQISENTVKVTYYHSNGKVMHQGNYIDGKAAGLWKSYDETGNKMQTVDVDGIGGGISLGFVYFITKSFGVQASFAGLTYTSASFDEFE